MKKILSAILAVLMLSSVFVACTKNNDDGSDATTDGNAPYTTSGNASDNTSGNASENTTTEEVTTVVTENLDENGYLKDDLPDGLTFTDKEFSIIHWNDSTHEEFDSESISSDAIPNAIYMRNLAVETRLGLELEFIGIKGNNSNRNAFITTVGTSIKNNLGEYDLVGAYSMCSATLATQGCNTNLNALDYLDFSKPWWPERLIDEATVNDKLYFASGDLSTNMLWSMLIMICNKNLLTEYRITDELAKKVTTGEWTFDYFVSLVEKVSGDTDGVTGKSDGDTFGFTTSNVYSDALFFGAGLRTVERNSKGETVIAASFGSEKTQTYLTRLVNLFSGLNANYYESNYSNATYFIENKSLFELRPVYYISSTISGSSINYSVLPVPKYDSLQEEYVTTVGFTYTLYSIPKDTPDTARSAAVLECLASEAYRETTPVVYEITMKLKYAKEAEASQMFDVIREGVSFDLGRIYCLNFNSATKYATYNLWRYALNDKSTDWMSRFATDLPTLNSDLAAVLASLK